MRKTFMKDKKKANCDADMTLDIISQGYLDSYDEVIVMSGDGDFISVYEHLVNILKKKVTILATHDTHTNRKVKDLAKTGTVNFLDLTQFLNTYGIKMKIIL